MTATSPSIWTMLFHAGIMVQFVLVSLLVFSVICWTVIIVKVRRFSQASTANMEFEEQFWEGETLDRVNRIALRMPEAPMSGIFMQGYQELKQLMEDCRGRVPENAVGSWLQVIERGLEKGIQEELAMLERTIPLLATIGNAAPFIGLFGTVWGIMGSFHNIGLQGSASLATVAPGISEALVATAAGLAAAIPAVMAFNSFMTSMSGMEGILKGFAADFLNTVEKQLIAEAALKGKNDAGQGEMHFSIRGDLPDDDLDKLTGPEVF